VIPRSHNIWLRDHCRCPQCYHQTTKQRQLDTFAIPANIAPQSIEATTEGLVVEWPRIQSEQIADSSSGSGEQIGHSSLYPWSWLYSNSYAPSLSLPSAVEGGENIIMWGKGIAQQPPTVTYEEVMSDKDERGIARWLTKLVSPYSP
jgi:trimethyllysine dioxygenase